MSKILGKFFGRSKRAKDQGSHPNSTDASGHSSPDPHFAVPDPRSRSQSTSNPQRITDPYPSGQHILGPELTSSGQRVPIPRPSGQPTVHPHFGVQFPTGSRPRDQPTPNLRRINDQYPDGQRTPVSRSGGQPTVDRHFGAQYTPGPWSSSQPNLPRSSDQPIVDPHFGAQFTPGSRPSGQSKANPRHITNQYPGGQHTPVPRSSGQPINDGIYMITSVHHHRRVYLEDANDNTPLRGHHRPDFHSARWRVINYGNEQYSIENVDHNRHAYCGPLAGPKAFVEGYSREQLWRIQVRPTGEYTIATTDTRNLWMLPYDEPDTPVWLSDTYTDPRCWWTFESAETTAPVNRNFTIQPVHFKPKLPLPLSHRQLIPERAIIKFTSVIPGATDLLQPLRAACEPLRELIKMAKIIGHVNEERKSLINLLKIHLATVQNHIAELEEDQKIDDNIPALSQTVKESLETYASELRETYKLLLVYQPTDSPLANKLASQTRKTDEAFQTYTTALHLHAASMVDQMRQQLDQFRQELQQGSEKVRHNRLNAYGVQHRECLRGTREKTLSAISEWFDDEDTTKWIFFFLDVAGSGKSTVAKHMVEKWKREERLLARFFFSRDTTETMSTNLFCSTVAGAFADLDPNFKGHLNEFLKRPNVGLLPFEELFEGLVVGPLRAIGRRAILVIDALDECNPEQRDQLLDNLRGQHGSIPLLRVLATGRPERDIKRWAEEKFGFGYTNFTRLEGNDNDVELYIKHRLTDLPIIRGRLYPVIRRAEGLFIWARIACDLLLDSEDIDGLLDELGKEVSLDYLYKVALEQSIPKEGPSRRATVLVLQMILAAREPLSIAELEMLSPKPGVVERIVTCLGSVLLYQGREDPIRLLHATFREFLTTQSKADIFFIRLGLGHHTLASGCLNTISHLSKQDNSTLLNVDRISERKHISHLASYLLTLNPGLFITPQSHGHITAHARTKGWP